MCSHRTPGYTRCTARELGQILEGQSHLDVSSISPPDSLDSPILVLNDGYIESKSEGNNEEHDGQRQKMEQKQELGKQELEHEKEQKLEEKLGQEKKQKPKKRKTKRSKLIRQRQVKQEHEEKKELKRQEQDHGHEPMKNLELDQEHKEDKEGRDQKQKELASAIVKTCYDLPMEFEPKVKSSSLEYGSCIMGRTLIFVNAADNRSLYSQQMDQEEIVKLEFLEGCENKDIRHVVCSATSGQGARLAFITAEGNVYHAKKTEIDNQFACRLICKRAIKNAPRSKSPERHELAPYEFRKEVGFVLMNRKTRLVLSREGHLLAINTGSSTTIWEENPEAKELKDQVTPAFLSFIASFLRPDSKILFLCRYEPVIPWRHLCPSLKRGPYLYALPAATSLDGKMKVDLCFSSDGPTDPDYLGLTYLLLRFNNTEQKMALEQPDWFDGDDVPPLRWTISPQNSFHMITSDNRIVHYYMPKIE